MVTEAALPQPTTVSTIICKGRTLLIIQSWSPGLELPPGRPGTKGVWRFLRERGEERGKERGKDLEGERGVGGAGPPPPGVPRPSSRN